MRSQMWPHCFRTGRKMPRLSQTAASSILFGRVSDAALCSREPGEPAPNKGELAPTKGEHKVEHKGERSPQPFLVPVYCHVRLCCLCCASNLNYTHFDLLKNSKWAKTCQFLPQHIAMPSLVTGEMPKPEECIFIFYSIFLLAHCHKSLAKRLNMIFQ